MSKASTENVQFLFDAEKAALQVVQEAKKNRLTKLKQAREEAQKELNAYQQKVEAKFMAYKQEHLGNVDNMAHQINEKRDRSVQAIENAVKLNKERIVDILVEKVLEVHLE